MSADDRAFTHLVRELGGELLWIARGFAADDDEAEDLVQETWAQAYLKRDQFRGDGTVRGWILQVCRNLCIEHARSAVRRRRLLGRSPPDALISDQPATREPIPDRLTARLRSAWIALTPCQREVMRLLIEEDLTVCLIARRLGVREGIVKSRLHRSRKRMRDALPGGFGGDGERQATRGAGKPGSGSPVRGALPR